MVHTPVVIEVGDPLYIHHSDGPGLNLGFKFDGKSFLTWKRAILIALSVKNKLCFVDSTFPRPTAKTEAARASVLDRCNNLVISWIISTLDKPIADSVMFIPMAALIWKQLQSRFGKGTGSQKFSIQKEIASISQGTDDISTYFTRLSRLWDELDSIRIIPPCTYAAVTAIRAFEEEQRLYQFLMGLQENYSLIRGHILMTTPLLDVDNAYSTLIEEEHQRQIKPNSIVPQDSVSFQAGSNFAPKSNYKGKNPIFFSHCKKPGHLIDNCYKIIRYPSKNPDSTPKSASVHNVQSAEASLSLSASEFAQLRQLLHSTSSPAFTNLSGIAHYSFAGFGLNSMNRVWIVDSGASDHMCFQLSLFLDQRTLVVPITVNLPNGNTLMVTTVGSVQLTADIIIQNVLYVPTFFFNLLSVKRLVEQLGCSIEFNATLCTLQGLKLNQPIVSTLR